MYYSFPDACAKNKLLKSIFKEIVYTKENGGRWSPNAIDDFQLEFISRLD